MFVSYAQNFEDVMLHRALRKIKSGFFIDIGAQDPVVDSVSQGFVELGWHGVNVEPSFTFAAKLKANRPMDDLIEAVIGCSSEDVVFYDIPETGLSTTLKHLAERHRSEGYPVKERKVRSLSLDDLLDKYSDRDVHWLKIHAGGAEQDIVKSWVSTVVRPWIVVIAAVEPLTTIPTHCHWEDHIFQLGYQFVYFDGINRFYVAIQRPELAKHFDHGPSCLDNFTLTKTCRMNSAVLREILQHKAVILGHRALCAAFSAQAKQAKQELRDSYSWRLTAPLRRISNAGSLLVKNPIAFVAKAKSKLASKRGSEIATAKQKSAPLSEAGPGINPSTPDSTSLSGMNLSLQVLRDLERAMTLIN